MNARQQCGTWLACAATTVLLVVGRSAAESPPSSGAEQGGLAHGTQGFVLAPTRIVFEDRKRVATLTVANTGLSVATYRVALVRMRMSESGEIAPVDVAQEGEAFADTLLRFSPRQFEVLPHATQIVRIQLRKPEDLADGEYRSHLVVQENPPADAGRPDSIAPTPGGAAEPGVAVRLAPVFATAIPIIVRQGAPSARLSMTDFHYRPAGGPANPAVVSLTLVRDGSRSVYGDLECVDPQGGKKPRVIGRMRGVAVYTPNRTRRIDLPLDPTPPAFHDGRLQIRFTETAPHVPALAESSFIVG